MDKTKILGFWSGHDCSYSILENGRPTIHNEYERFLREKEPPGDAIDFFLRQHRPAEVESIKYAATCYPISKAAGYDSSWKIINEICKSNNGNVFIVGHHQAHAANAFFSSNFQKSLVVTVDGGGVESNEGIATATTAWLGNDNKISPIQIVPLSSMNIGGVWTRVTRYVFKLQSGWPRGHQAGSVMAMAAMGNPNRFYSDFLTILTKDMLAASLKPTTQPKGALIPGRDPVHPYLNKWAKIADESEQNRFDIAAALQKATEDVFFSFLEKVLSKVDVNSLCLSGGVTLNSVLVGKIQEKFPEIKNLYIPPVPYDGGLAIGAAQLVHHQILENDRIVWKDNFTPYLGKKYSGKQIENTLLNFKDKIWCNKAVDSDVIDLLTRGRIISVYGSKSESGRRALGNRSILADPRNKEMKDLINKKVKHRQWYRPFAPSILRSEVSKWFVRDVDSPYMTQVIKFKDDVRDIVPAVVHFNGTARLQTVTSNDNKWYYNFLMNWFRETNVPMLLNTSFNDREPIVETPAHALDCFLRTDIDYLYFYDEGILVEKIESTSK